MGWGRGYSLADEVWTLMARNMPYDPPLDHEKIIIAKIAIELVELFEHYDCDTMMDCNFVQELLDYDEDKSEWKVK